MIFIILGSQKFQFNRLLQTMDNLVERGTVTDEVFAQSGYSDYEPRYYSFKSFLDRNKFEEMQTKANIIITHGGTGAIIGAIKKRKKVIAVPCMAEYGEHVDDHQLQIIGQFREQDLICGLNDCSELEKALQSVVDYKFRNYQSNTNIIIDSIEKFIKS